MNTTVHLTLGATHVGHGNKDETSGINDIVWSIQDTLLQIFHHQQQSKLPGSIIADQLAENELFGSSSEQLSA